MKNLRFFSIILTTLLVGISLSFTSCEGDVGPAGPAGPQGPVGATGPAGATGQTGNANVIQFSYGARTWANTVGSRQDFALNNISGAVLSSSVAISYIGLANPNGADFFWNLVPGNVLGAGTLNYGEFISIVNVNPTATPTGGGLIIRRETLGTSGVLTAPVRIILIPANDLRNGRKAPVDFSDYNAVKAYYNLKD